MSAIGQGGGARRPPIRKKVFRIAATPWGLVAQAWPRRRGLPADRYQRSILDRMATVVRHVKALKEIEVATTRRIIDEWNTRNHGKTGPGTVRLRDLLQQNAMGRAWAIQLPDGRTIYHIDALQDISRRLDWLEPKVGSMLTRTPEGWRPTSPCEPGAKFRCVPSVPLSGCCQQAQYFPNEV